MRALPQIIALYLILIIAWVAYQPGLKGDFLFDDFGNLPALGATGPIDNINAFARYITSGNADVTGRPVALATFLLDAQDWPASPASFKHTNVLIHLLNGTLLVWALLLLGRVLQLPEKISQNAAITGAGIWLLHPFFVSTTLYIVQREAMLPATFTLLALVAWVKGYNRLLSNSRRSGLAMMGIAIMACTPLAVLSKANGALLPLLLLVVNSTILAPNASASSNTIRVYRYASYLLLVIPSLLLIIWLVAKIPSSMESAAETRSWTVYQRLLSEPRVITEYLVRLAIPRSSSRGLFNDAIQASTGLMHPWTTLPCMLLIAGLIILGLRLHRTHPTWALTILFYFAGHIIESTWIPLELYYEHRNYLPATLLFWPVSIAIFTNLYPTKIQSLLAAIVLGLLAILTRLHATQWGDGYLLANVWASINSTSTRAQANAASYEIAHGRSGLAARRLQAALAINPLDIQVPVNLIGAECKLGSVRPETIHALSYALSHAKSGSELTYHWFNDLISLARSYSCVGLDLDTAAMLLRSAQDNSYWQALPGKRQDLDHLEGLLELAEGAPQAALNSFNRALAQQPRPDAALEQAALLGSAGQPELGLAHLSYFDTLPPPAQPPVGMPMLHAWILREQHYWPHELAHLKETLTADTKEKHEK
ncbi:tetratricopeptide repeat protein [Dyella sedimenti]|uniref:tetratricopeptide repeat protein n=1 Tax=Dyella sedimenti TaxID=2919947 RepID=UPI001FAAC766|nr:tetratricopeptide repeat protein [Dyella sedimenti]